jgi:hypothetical protein
MKSLSQFDGVHVPNSLGGGYRRQPPRKECLLKVWTLVCATSALFLTMPAHALTIDPTYGSGVTGDEQVSIEDAINTIESTYQSDVTVNILFQNGTLGTGRVAQSQSSFDEDTYAAYVSLLTQKFNASHNSVQSSVLANLQFGNDANGARQVKATSAEWRNLGAMAAPCLTAGGAFNCAAGKFDGIITLNSSDSFNFAGIKPQPSATLDPVAAFEHEIDEVLGGGDSGTTLRNPASTAFGPTDLLRYSGFHEPSYSETAMSFLSFDGGLTDQVGLIPGFGDFTTICTDPQGTLCPGDSAPYTATDIDMMEAIGYNTALTPLPATLPLFASGLGVLGLLGWRRKRKARVSCRVGEDVATLAPHSPVRAGFPHTVLHVRASFQLV